LRPVSVIERMIIFCATRKISIVGAAEIAAPAMSWPYSLK